MNTPAVITSKMMWEELQEIKKALKGLTKTTISESIQEISLSQTAKLLKLGRASVMALINTGTLKARRYKDCNGRERYRIRIVDIKEFQEFTRVNEEAVKARLAEEEETLKKMKSKASSDFMVWAKNQVEANRAKNIEKQQTKGAR